MTTSARLYHLVQVADKYDCLGALRLQVKTLMQIKFDELDRGTMKYNSAVLCAAAAYLLGDAK